MKTLPPHSLEFEQSVLGAILVRPEALGKVAEILKPGDFYREAHSRIYQAILDLAGRGDPVDLVTTTMLLKERGQLEAVGGRVFLAGLSEQVGFAANVDYYAREVARKAYFRQKIELAHKIIVACDNSGNGLENLIAKISQEPRHIKGGISPISAKELGEKEFAPPRWAIPELIPEGLTILGGRPKVGKSWLCLSLAVAVATGGMALGKIQVDQGEALFLALEDPPRRLKERLDKIMPFGALPASLHFLTATDFPPLFQGGLDALSAWLKEHSQARLLVIDTFGRIKPPRGRNADSYDHDVQIMGILQGLSVQHKIALVLVHHTKKLNEVDFLANLSGTHGLTGSADCVAELTRTARGQMDGTLKLTGRDIEEQELAMRFVPDLGLWEIMGEAREFSKSQERQEILLVLRENGPISANQLAEITGKNIGTIRKILYRMKEKGELRLDDKNRYVVS